MGQVLSSLTRLAWGAVDPRSRVGAFGPVCNGLGCARRQESSAQKFSCGLTSWPCGCYNLRALINPHPSMKHTQSLLAGLLAAGASLTGTAQVIVNETFDTYADTAAMQANWGAAGAGSLETGIGNPGQSARHPGGVVNTWIGSSFSLTPTASEWFRLSADIFDDGTSANKRMTVGLRNGANPLFEMGMYNSPAYYAVRVLSFSGSPNWVAFPAQGDFVNAPVEGWHRFTAEFYVDRITISLDLHSDGNVDVVYTSFGAPSANPFNDLRFGGPSNLSSVGGGAWFDNIRLEVIPEPSSAALLLLGLGGLWAARSRRSAV